MFTGTITFIVSWLAFFSFSNKKKLPLFLSTIYLGIIYSFITDLLILIYPLWYYPGTKLEIFFIQILNGFGIYFVVIYFFLHSLPKKQTNLSIIRYIFYWTAFSIVIELIYLYIGFIEHRLWWNIGLSYLADWILFGMFYLHHRWVSNK